MSNRKTQINARTTVKRSAENLITDYDLFISTKSQILNTPEVFSYIFNKPILISNSIIQSLNLMLKEIKSIYCTKKTKEKIDALFFQLGPIIESFYSSYCEYKTIASKYKHFFGNINFLSDLKKQKIDSMVVPEKCDVVSGIIGVLKNKEVDCIAVDFSFKLECEILCTKEIPKYNFDLDLKVDIYGIIFIKNFDDDELYQMIQFAIIYEKDRDLEKDSDGKFKPRTYSKLDFITQSLLCQFNIHLLRLNTESEIKKETLKFLSRIKKSDFFVCNRVINPKQNIYWSKNDIQSKFNYNHGTYIKYYEPLLSYPEIKYDPETNNKCENNFDNKPIPISEDFLSKLSNYSIIYKLPV